MTQYVLFSAMSIDKGRQIPWLRAFGSLTILKAFNKNRWQAAMLESCFSMPKVKFGVNMTFRILAWWIIGRKWSKQIEVTGYFIFKFQTIRKWCWMRLLEGNVEPFSSNFVNLGKKFHSTWNGEKWAGNQWGEKMEQVYLQRIWSKENLFQWQKCFQR